MSGRALSLTMPAAARVFSYAHSLNRTHPFFGARIASIGIASVHLFRGIYKAFVKLGSPEFVIKRIAAVHATYFQGVPIEVQLQGHGKAVVRYTGFEKQHRIMGFAIMGFFKKALEISGATDVVLCFTIPIEEGKAFSELSISWR
jgi:hypothetical protein